MTVHQRLATNYSAIRERILNAKPREFPQEDLREARIISLGCQIAELLTKVALMELNIADYQAAVLRQGEIISQLGGMDGSAFEIRETTRDICEEVLKDYPGITYRDIISANRNKRFVIPRHRCMYEIHERRPDLSFPLIGKIFNRDHSTVVHAVQKLKAELLKDAA